MTLKSYKDTEAIRNRSEISDFLLNKVVADFDRDDMVALEIFMNDGIQPRAASFVDYLELGNWFYAAMDECDFDVERFMEELEAKIVEDEKESAEFQAELE